MTGKLKAIVGLLGVYPDDLKNNVLGLWPYVKDLREIKRQRGNSSHPDEYKLMLNPRLGDRTQLAGVATGHYFHQDLLVARRIHKSNPSSHADVGSRVDGFVAHVASFREIDVFDIRPQHKSVVNIRFVQADLMDEAIKISERYPSVSCLHALEHFGLGRYGDSVDLFGHVKGLSGISRLVEPGGILYLSVPIGPQRIQFNAHRVFNPRTIVELTKGEYEIEAFSFVDDLGDLKEDVAVTEAGLESSFGCKHGCGIFELRKKR